MGEKMRKDRSRGVSVAKKRVAWRTSGSERP
jgi:hypothetical protein